MKRTLSTVLAAILLTAFSAAAWAVTFPAADVNDGVPQVVQVPGDYATLSAASAGFNAMTGGVKRNWTIEITGNVNETAFVFFGNSFAFTTATLTFKPAPATNPVVTWNASIAAPAGWYGHLVIGASDGTNNYATNTFPSNGNYIIDGSNTVGGTTRDLTFRVGTSAAGAVSNTNHLIRIVGDNDAVVVKNTNVEFYDNTGTSAAIGFAQGNWNSTNYIPDNGLIKNCYVTCGVGTGTQTANGFGIEANTGAGTVNAAAPMGLTVEDCDIVVSQRAFNFTYIGSFNLYRNNIAVGTATRPVASGLLAYGVFQNSINGITSAFTVNIDGNVFTANTAGVTANGTNGLILVTLAGTNTAGITYNIRNNIIRDITIGGSAFRQYYRGFVCTGASGIYYIEHNTIDMPEQAAVAATTAGDTYAFGLASHSGVGLTVMKNNLIRYGELSTVGRLIHSGNATAKTIQGNNLVPVGAVPAVGVVASTTYATFAAWQGAGYDTAATGGQSVDPASTTPPWDANRKFSGITGCPSEIEGVASSSVLTDIDGDVRPAAGACPGADQPVGGTNARPTGVLAAAFNEGNAPASVVSTLSVVDPDAGDTHTLTLVAGAGDTDNALFTIVNGNELQISEEANFEVKSSYSIRVKAQDGGSPAMFYVTAVEVAVNDVNETPTDIALSANEAYEGAAVGAEIGTFTTTDPDNGQSFTYTLVSGAGDTDNAMFQITNNKLQNGAGVTPGVKSIRVRSTDSGSPSQYLEEIFTITVYEVRVDVSRAPAAGPYYADTNFTVDVVVGANDSPTTPHVSAFRVRFTSETLTLVGATASYSEFSTLAPDPGNAIFGQLGVTWGTVPPIVSAAPLSPAAVIPISTLGDLENNDKTPEVIRLEFKVNAWVTSPVQTEIVIEDDPNAGGAFLSHWKSSPFEIIEIPHTFNNMAAFEVGGTANSVSDWLFQQ